MSPGTQPALHIKLSCPAGFHPHLLEPELPFYLFNFYYIKVVCGCKGDLEKWKEENNSLVLMPLNNFLRI